MAYRPSHRQLEYLVALGETGHFGDAARRCHVSQPTLSVQIGLLEKQLGVVLIDRTPGRIAPTPAGKAIITAARSVLTGLDDITALASTSRTNLGGLIRLGVVPTFGPYFLPHLLPRLHALYRDLRVHVREDRPLFLEEQVLSGQSDCALAPDPGPGSALTFRPICRERIFLGVADSHPLAARASVPLAAIRGERLLTLGRGHRLLENVRALADVSGAVLAEDYEGTSLAALRQMVSIEMGMSLFPELYVRSEMDWGGTVRLLTIEDWTAERSIGFLWRQGSARAAHYEALATLAETVAEDVMSDRSDL